MRYSSRYTVLAFISRTAKYVYYKKYVKRNSPKIGKNEPVLLIANHQNGLTDALHCGVATSRQIHFLTRADVFKNPKADKFLRSLHLLPIYRMRDGKDKMDRNEAIFEECFKRLGEGDVMGIFPEGNHSQKKYLRPFKAGPARMALGAEAAKDYQLGVKILPVGLNYTNYEHCGYNVMVDFGDMFTIEEYYEKHKENPQQAIRDLTAVFSEKLAKVVVHNDGEELYDAWEEIRGMQSHEVFDVAKKFDTENELLQKLKAHKDVNEAEAKTYADKALAYGEAVRKLKIKKWHFTRDFSAENMIIHVLLQILTLPIMLIGVLGNIIPHSIVESIVNKIVKDPHFTAAIRLGSGMFLFPILWLTQASIIGAFTNWKIGLISIPVSVLTGLVTRRWLRLWHRFKSKQRYRKLKKENNSDFAAVQNLRNELYTWTSKLMSEKT